MTEQPNRVVVTTSWDDGHVLDHRLAELLHANAISATFYLAPDNVEIEPARRLSAAGVVELAEQFEIGGHTLRHLALTTLSDVDAREEMRAGKRRIEDVTGTAVTSFCYPLGAYRRVHVQQARALGFTLARTVRRSSLRIGPPMEMATTVNAYRHLVDGALAVRLAGGHPGRALRYFQHWDELAMRWFDLCLARGGVYHLWGHSWEIDARGDWDRLRRVLRHIGGRPEVTYRTNRETADLLAVAR